MSINKLIKGHQNFNRDFNNNKEHLLKKLTNIQKPSTVFVSCCDSRVDPGMITHANYGDIFVIRNVANIIPPLNDEHDTYHGTTSALEYAINHLEVENLIVMGHSNCGGIKALLADKFDDEKDSFIKDWIAILNPIKKNIPYGLSEEEKLHFTEKEAIKHSLKNAFTFDFVKKRHDQGKLRVLGWYFDIEAGKMYQYCDIRQDFVDLCEHEI